MLYEKRGAVGILTLSRPQARNAWGEDYNAAQPKAAKKPPAKKPSKPRQQTAVQVQ